MNPSDEADQSNPDDVALQSASAPPVSAARPSTAAGHRDSTGRADPVHTIDHVPADEAETDRTNNYISAPDDTEKTIDHVSRPVAERPVGRLRIPGYELFEVLGRGGMGIVYKARQIKADRTVALKLMRHAEDADPISLERFDIEAQAVARLQHPNIVQVFEVGEADGSPFFSLEYLAGGTLAQKIKQSLPSPKEAAACVRTLTAAMAFAHKANIVHRDLKPANVLLADDGTPKIADFGLARKLEADSRVTQTGQAFGTPSYMPPEQAEGGLDTVGPPADVYSLGAILYELLTGRPPFVGANTWETIEQVRNAEPVAPRVLRPGTPRDLETICLKCLQKSMAKRYESADALADDLQRYLDGRPIQARPVGGVERCVRWCRRNPWPTALMGVLAVGAAASTAAALYINKQRVKNDTLVVDLRGMLFKVANEAPDIGENQPLATGMRQELLELVAQLLSDSQGQVEVGIAKDHGRLAVEIRSAKLALVKQEYEKAERHYADARKLAEDELAGNPPERDKVAGNFASVLNDQARFLVSRGRVSEAIDGLNEAVVHRKQVAEAPKSGEIPPAQAQAELGRTLIQLGEALQAKGEPDAAMNSVRDGIAILEQVSPDALTPRRAEQVRKDLAAAHAHRGEIFLALQQPAEAQKAYAQAFALWRGLIEKSPQNMALRVLFAVHLGAYGDWLMVSGNDPATAAKLYEESQSLYRAVLTTPELVNLQQTGEAMGWYRRGTAASRLGKADEARGYFQRCFVLRDKRVNDLEATPPPKGGEAAYRWEVVAAKIERMLAQARAGMHADAAKTAENLLKLAERKPAPGEKDRRGLQYLQAACGFALCSAEVPADSPVRAGYVKKSLAALRLAVANGFRNTPFLESDPDLDPVRPLPEFQELLTAAKKSQPR